MGPAPGSANLPAHPRRLTFSAAAARVTEHVRGAGPGAKHAGRLWGRGQGRAPGRGYRVGLRRKAHSGDRGTGVARAVARGEPREEPTGC